MKWMIYYCAFDWLTGNILRCKKVSDARCSQYQRGMRVLSSGTRSWASWSQSWGDIRTGDQGGPGPLLTCSHWSDGSCRRRCCWRCSCWECSAARWSAWRCPPGCLRWFCPYPRPPLCSQFFRQHSLWTLWGGRRRGRGWPRWWWSGSWRGGEDVTDWSLVTKWVYDLYWPGCPGPWAGIRHFRQSRYFQQLGITRPGPGSLLQWRRWSQQLETGHRKDTRPILSCKCGSHNIW